MKKITIILIFIAASLQLSAQVQTSVIDRFFQKYEDDRSFTLVSITPKMFSMFSKLDINTGEGQQFMQVVKKLKGLRILAKEDAKDGSRLYKEAANFLTKDFEELMTVRDDDTDLKFLVKENAKGNISELVMLVGSTDEFVAMSLLGDIDLNEISQIASGMNIHGMDNLKKLKK
ncbi:DUF4252 domain-containing protein [Chitinophaga agrisoli]|uniref:DUF4252 domain-containing protein n=1 Tax=Chitinophaga agrisoli TaxID=2607653 RepID=A0A5B2VV56_9BACT|nr:DUF4252 domain-containing protein [Chitinophaga agrisoli]KAA2242468.1 DUF4252 domain-containing protein [Chitinophaga agrisoli]